MRFETARDAARPDVADFGADAGEPDPPAQGRVRVRRALKREAQPREAGILMEWGRLRSARSLR
jgi:hypothetical protein